MSNPNFIDQGATSPGPEPAHLHHGHVPRRRESHVGIARAEVPVRADLRDEEELAQGAPTLHLDLHVRVGRRALISGSADLVVVGVRQEAHQTEGHEVFFCG